MNFKTTLFLAIALIVVAGVVYLAGSKEQPSGGPPPAPTELLADTLLISEDFGEVVKVVCKRREGQEWTFERPAEQDDAGQEQWSITSPLQVKATSWQVQGLVRKLTQLKYQIKYAAGSAGAVTAAQAGLDPPQSIVTLESEDGDTVTVEIGRDLSTRESYVRLAGSDDIYVVSPTIAKLVKEKAIEYREQKLLDIQAKHITRLEVTDRPDYGKPVIYTLVRSVAGWTMETPSKAPAVKDKIDTLAQTVQHLSVTAWAEAEAKDLSLYGLADEGLTVRVTVEEPVEKEAEEEGEYGEEEPPDEQESPDEPAEPAEDAEPELIVRELVVHVSRRSPLGEDTKVYVCKGGERAVGTMAKTTADRLTPNPSEWRDMRLTTAAVNTADRVELTTPQGSVTFTKEQGKWAEADSGEGVDGDAVSELLTQLKNLKASNYVSLAAGSPAAFGLDDPQAVIRLNVPGEPEAERFTVGGYTDAKTRRLVYVRHKESDSVAKVRVADANKLTRPASEYRDRTIFEFKPEEIEKVTITRQDDLIGGRFTFALGKVGAKLQITEPVAAKTSEAQVNKLTKTLAALKASRVVAETDPIAYGLDAPAVRCEITRQPPEITKYVQVPVEPDETSSEESKEEAPATQPADQPKTKLKAEKHKPPAETLELSVTEHDGKVYARRGDRSTIYEVARSLLKELQAEYHEPAIFDFQESQVVSVTGPDPEGRPIELSKVDDQWQYAGEPDLPIDAKKVTDLLLRIKNLETERFVAYGVADSAEYGLDQPWRSAKLQLEDAIEVGLLVSQRICEKDPEKRHYAALAGATDVFLLPDDAVEGFVIDLAELEAP
ncbi:MAG: DUF4340 domain-containing protein [Planctomycetota bacterium]|jgi:hypothetical protein